MFSSTYKQVPYSSVKKIVLHTDFRVQEQSQKEH